MIKKGVHGEYTWFQSTENYLTVLVDQVKELVVGKTVAIVAYEGEPIRLTQEEMKAGWQQLSTVALSPIIDRPSEIPQNSYDEWYAFAGVSALPINESFATCGGFSLDQSAGENPFLPQSLKKKQIDTTLRKRQERFWKQLELLKPESYMAETDKLIVVTKNPALVARLNDFFSKGSFRLPNNARLRRRGLVNGYQPKKL
jgi:hypothetical protein